MSLSDVAPRKSSGSRHRTALVLSSWRGTVVTVADAELFHFPGPVEVSLDVTTFGEVCGALACRLDRGDVDSVKAELRMLERDYAEIEIPVLPQDR